MAVRAFDHAVIPTAQPDEMIAFYRSLGFSVVGEEAWREGRSPMFAFAFGDNKINVHPPAVWQNQSFTLRGPSALPGCGDFCFVWDGDVEALQALLAEAKAEVIVGPVQRQGGKQLGAAYGTSHYTRDPDGNLLEFIIYE
jgi:catechol 2,3-dioxygenase-like lactoylglutathione lyase family enzyme